MLSSDDAKWSSCFAYKNEYPLENCNVLLNYKKCYKANVVAKVS